MGTTIIDFITMLATVFAAAGAVYFAKKANQIADEQTGFAKKQTTLAQQQTEIAKTQTAIAQQQMEIEQRQSEAEQIPALKFVVTASIDNHGEANGYDFSVINHGKAPAVLNLPTITDFQQPICKARNLLQINHRHLNDPEGTAFQADTFAFFSAKQKETRKDKVIGNFEKAFANSVIVMPLNQQLFFHANKDLGYVLTEKEKYYIRHPLAFYFHESIENRDYVLTICQQNTEGITMHVNDLAEFDQATVAQA